ncbi:MAG: 4-hydroxythreonine-4-phosphate dehydrogenase 2 [Alphaproteobacteria bacterium MarineAlpha5_Bin7]|nr:MAG: 4-hydroxythreonine-4-phosphate dehydrogenase 2 [Alphaproteobacteria bacterium MarineAlpha5_Bin7]|tara:strand:+ start:1986 stop:2948 length:963 start_codon:yes stop_codon:yes gene_type:complete
MNKLIAVTIGDINGVGIKILINLWLANKINNFVLVTNLNIFNNFLKKNKIKLPLELYKTKKQLNYNKKYFYIYDYPSKNDIENTYLSLKKSYDLTINKYCKGIITLPLNKNIIKKNCNKNFMGQTEYFQNIDNKNISNMIFYSNNLIILTLTTHIPIKRINYYIKKKNYIFDKIESFNKTLIKDFNIKKPRIAISGVNPHAGEEGIIGNEEKKYILPIIKKLKKNNINIIGPLSADSLFYKENLKKYDSFICFYHDQALIPFKILKGFNGINYTGSLNIIRISPDHGTAYDVTINEINNNSLYECFKNINFFINNRSKID